MTQYQQLENINLVLYFKTRTEWFNHLNYEPILSKFRLFEQFDHHFVSVEP